MIHGVPKGNVVIGLYSYAAIIEGNAKDNNLFENEIPLTGRLFQSLTLNDS